MLVWMARVLPFRPYRYSPKAGDLASLVTQPYDKIPDGLREQYLQANPYNFVRLIKGKPLDGDDDTHNVYTRASETLAQWIEQDILVEDPYPGFYAYFQEFEHPETGAKTIRKGFIGLTDVEEYDKGIVHRHELTHSGPKVDRWKLTEATQTYFGQLFFLYDDPTGGVDELLEAAAAGEPLMAAQEPDGVVHKVWRIGDAEQISGMQRLMEDKKLLIADGHHRYETALAYGREHPETPGASQVMVTLVNMSSPGLVVLATHRVLSNLSNFAPRQLLEKASWRFEISRAASNEALRQALDREPRGAAIGLVLAGDDGRYLLTPKPGALEDMGGLSEAESRLDVVLLHKTLIGDAAGLSEDDVRELKGIRYVRGFENAIAEVDSGAAQAAFLLRPADIQDVARISFSGGVMPQKSTDFYPKLLAGFTTYRFGPPTTR
jgi:uncharacterized protein (DUF1015 family)